MFEKHRLHIFQRHSGPMKSQGCVDWPAMKKPLPLVVTLESEAGRKGGMQPTNTHGNIGLGGQTGRLQHTASFP
jgi:hypothetical protein